VLATEWNAFRALQLRAHPARDEGAESHRLRNVYDAQRMKGSASIYTSVGRAEDVRKAVTA